MAVYTVNTKRGITFIIFPIWGGGGGGGEGVSEL